MHNIPIYLCYINILGKCILHLVKNLIRFIWPSFLQYHGHDLERSRFYIYHGACEKHLMIKNREAILRTSIF